MICEKTDVSLMLDTVNNVLHILDTDTSGTMSVTNAVSKEYLTTLLLEGYNIEKELTPSILQRYAIYLYGTDGLIAEWSDRNIPNFRHVPYDSPLVYEAFRYVMEQRLLNN